MYQVEDSKAHAIILKKPMPGGESPKKPANRSPVGERGSLKSIIQQSLQSVKNLAQIPGGPSAGSPSAKGPSTKKSRGNTQER